MDNDNQVKVEDSRFEEMTRFALEASPIERAIAHAYISGLRAKSMMEQKDKEESA